MRVVDLFSSSATTTGNSLIILWYLNLSSLFTLLINQKMEVLIHCKNSLRFVGLYDCWESVQGKLRLFAYFFGMLVSTVPVFIFCFRNAHDFILLITATYAAIGQASLILMFLDFAMNTSLITTMFIRLEEVIDKRKLKRFE